MGTYPDKINRTRTPSPVTVQLVRELQPAVYAEIGCYECVTAAAVAEAMPPESEIHLFDFASTLDRHARKVKHPKVVLHGCSQKLRDSYCWSLMRLLQTREEPFFDYVYVDGAHTWDVDGFAFCLVDRLLRVGGHVEFDNYAWTLKRSGSLSPRNFPKTAEFYTPEQITTPQVGLVVDLLVKPNRRYKTVVENRVFKKLAHDGAANADPAVPAEVR